MGLLFSVSMVCDLAGTLVTRLAPTYILRDKRPLRAVHTTTHLMRLMRLRPAPHVRARPG
jgi:hypothetical protein